MPSNQTKNYGLNQWERSDQVLMDDFNADNLAIDEALKAQADAVTAEKSAREAAITAEAAARQVLEAALTNKGNCTVETFTYQGSGSYGADSPTKVRFSKSPAAFIIFGNNLMMGRGGETPAGIIYSLSSSGCAVGTVPTSWSGGTLSISHNTNAARQMNAQGITYQVIAFYTP